MVSVPARSEYSHRRTSAGGSSSSTGKTPLSVSGSISLLSLLLGVVVDRLQANARLAFFHARADLADQGVAVLLVRDVVVEVLPDDVVGAVDDFVHRTRVLVQLTLECADDRGPRLVAVCRVERRGIRDRLLAFGQRRCRLLAAAPGATLHVPVLVQVDRPALRVRVLAQLVALEDVHV